MLDTSNESVSLDTLNFIVFSSRLMSASVTPLMPLISNFTSTVPPNPSHAANKITKIIFTKDLLLGNVKDVLNENIILM